MIDALVGAVCLLVIAAAVYAAVLYERRERRRDAARRAARGSMVRMAPFLARAIAAFGENERAMRKLDAALRALDAFGMSAEEYAKNLERTRIGAGTR